MATTEMNKLNAALTEMGIEDFTGGGLWTISD